MKGSLIKTGYALMIAAFLALAGCSNGNGNNNNPSQNDQPVSNIVETAVAGGGFQNLVTVLQATGLDAVLVDETQSFTVFAPTDDAFALLGEETIAALLEDPDTLSDILLYHVISDMAVDSAAAISLAGSMVEMANGDSVTVTVQGEVLLINESRVVGPDVMASNGVIHVIDAVLIPPGS